jgi:hypothetical protein
MNQIWEERAVSEEEEWEEDEEDWEDWKEEF